MKRPPGLWLLLTIVAVWLRIDDVYSLRATSLIFAKTSTTTTTDAPISDASAETKSGEGVTVANSSPETQTQNSSKPVLTGIPQIDYIWDPNLPRELNGYNLSEYPFYDRVPVNISFKCDGLHDGFYASVPHKCQLYHHCLFGIRYDFLCANYTAFDQKTFICHFVSEVDCVNSKKFWHRNDALYQAASTTTVKPPPPVYTLPPAPATPVPVPILPLRPTRPRRPPMKRPTRPYDYYEEDYADEEYYERPYRRQRPKYRPRYDDEYEYEEEEYSRRPGRRRPYKQRGSNRRRPAYDDEEYEEEEEARKPADNNRRTPEESRRPAKGRPIEDEDYDRRASDRPRKKTYRRPIEDDYEEDAPPRRLPERRKLKNNRDDPRKYEEDQEEEERPRKSNREDRPRKNYDRNRNDDDTDKPRNRNDRNRSEDAPNDEKMRKNERNKNEEIPYEEKPLTKPPSSVYDRPRPMLKIRPPVPAHEQAKYAPRITTTTPLPLEDEEYYDEYEEDIKKKEEPRRSKDSINTRINPIPSSTPKREFESKRNQDYEDDLDIKRKEEPRRSKDSINTRTNPIPSTTAKREFDSKRNQDDYEDDLDTATRRYNKRPEYKDTNRDRRVNINSRRRPALDEEYEEYEESTNDKKPNNDQKTSTTTTTTKEPPREPIVKVVKRPFLPSRGGHPYTSRGLLPVGTKALDATINDQNSTQEKKAEVEEEKFETKSEDIKPFKSSPILVKIPVRKNNNYNDEEYRPVSNRPLTRIVKIMTTTTSTTTTEKPKVLEKNPLDIDESEYDVTLNDALNPTLPNLPIRNFPTGFSSQNDYTYNTVPRQRYVLDPLINQASSDYVYRIEQPDQISNNIRYKSQHVPIFQSYRQNPRVTQAFYSPY